MCTLLQLKQPEPYKATPCAKTKAEFTCLEVHSPSSPTSLPGQGQEMLSSTSNRPQSPLRIKQDDKFYSRLLSKESSLANPSFRVYYGLAPGSVPFLWESQPGTPKDAVATSTLPPLTPPPSSHFNPMKSMATKKKKKKKSSSGLNLITTLFIRLDPRKARLASPPMSSSSVSSSSSYSSQFGSSVCHQHSRFLRSRSSSSSRRDHEDYDNEPSRSFLCFQVRQIPRLLFHRNRK